MKKLYNGIKNHLFYLKYKHQSVVKSQLGFDFINSFSNKKRNIKDVSEISIFNCPLDAFKKTFDFIFSRFALFYRITPATLKTKRMPFWTKICRFTTNWTFCNAFHIFSQISAKFFKKFRLINSHDTFF